MDDPLVGAHACTRVSSSYDSRCAASEHDAQMIQPPRRHLFIKRICDLRVAPFGGQPSKVVALEFHQTPRKGDHRRRRDFAMATTKGLKPHKQYTVFLKLIQQSRCDSFSPVSLLRNRGKCLRAFIAPSGDTHLGCERTLSGRAASCHTQRRGRLVSDFEEASNSIKPERPVGRSVGRLGGCRKRPRLSRASDLPKNTSSFGWLLWLFLSRAFRRKAAQAMILSLLAGSFAGSLA